MCFDDGVGGELENDMRLPLYIVVALDHAQTNQGKNLEHLPVMILPCC